MAFVQPRSGAGAAHRHEEALKDYTSAIEMTVRCGGVQQQGKRVRQNGGLWKAFLDYNKAIALDSTYSDAYLNRGYAYSIVGNIERALRDITRAAELDPLHTGRMPTEDVSWRRVGNMQGAISDCSSRSGPQSIFRLHCNAVNAETCCSKPLNSPCPSPTTAWP